VRLDPQQAPPAIEVMAKDPNSVIRKAAAFEARYVRRKEVIQPLIDLLGDEEKFVAMSAVQSLWTLTRHETEFHDWDASNKQDRQAWSQEWVEWWNQSKDTFEIPEPKGRKQAG
jgi:HEAT repeat protein